MNLNKILDELHSLYDKNVISPPKKSCGRGFATVKPKIILEYFKKHFPISYKYSIKNLNIKDSSNEVSIIADCSLIPATHSMQMILIDDSNLIFFYREYLPEVKKERKEMIKKGIMNHNNKNVFPIQIKFKRKFKWFMRNMQEYIFEKGDILDLSYGKYSNNRLTFTESFIGNDPNMPSDIPLERLFPDVNFLQKNNLFQLLD